MADDESMKIRYQLFSLLAVFCVILPASSKSGLADLADLYQLPQTGLNPREDVGKGPSTPPKNTALPVQHYNRWLPLLGEQAVERGYELPLPFGIGINYMNIRQNIDVKSIAFSGLGLGNRALPGGLFAIDASKTRQYSQTRTLRLDTWILPFWDLYGITGQTRGHSMSSVGVDSDPDQFKGDLINQMIAGIIHGMHHAGSFDNLNFELKFKGNTYGIGTVLAGGSGDWYGLLDINYTQTRFDILDGSITALTVSPRAGYRVDTPGLRAIGLPPGKLNLWVGTMYQNVQQEFKGSLNDLSMPASLKALMAMANQKGEGRFDVKQHLQSPWNILLGVQYSMTKHFNLATELGFAERHSIMVSGEYRF